MTIGVGRNLEHYGDAFYDNLNPRRLANTLSLRGTKSNRSGTMLTLPSPVTLSAAHVEVAAEHGLTVVVAWGTLEHCVEAFHSRERQHPRGIGVNHWHHFNDACFTEYAKSTYGPLRLETFNADGSRCSRSEIIRDWEPSAALPTCRLNRNDRRRTGDRLRADRLLVNPRPIV